jgi:hypothetical protein
MTAGGGTGLGPEMRRQDLASDSLEIAQVVQVSAPFVFLFHGVPTDEALGVGMSIQQLIDQARERLRSIVYQRQRRRIRVRHGFSKRHFTRKAICRDADPIWVAYRTPAGFRGGERASLGVGELTVTVTAIALLYRPVAHRARARRECRK